MTSPVRARRDRSRRRLASDEASEIVSAARQCFVSQPRGDGGATSEPLTRSDMVLIRKAVRESWDVTAEKRESMMRQLQQAINGDDDWLALAAARTLMLMQAANLLSERTG